LGGAPGGAGPAGRPRAGGGPPAPAGAGGGAGRLPETLETTLYRVVQEALTNVVKHAQASNVSIVLTSKDGAATAVVEDDGRGFTPEDAAAGGIGLAGMRERLALVGGRLEIETHPDGGTTVVAEAPLR
jgi:two-component system, chemotaxis family, sensor kinase Cph1